MYPIIFFMYIYNILFYFIILRNAFYVPYMYFDLIVCTDFYNLGNDWFIKI